MAETTKDHTQIEINPPPPLRLSIDSIPDEYGKEQRVPFFGHLLRRKRENTWVISLFIIGHLVAFAATMIVNDCWQNSHGDCLLKPLGRLSFQPLSENPLLGPSASALDAMGALRQTFMTKHHKFWSVFTSPWLHAGVVHLIINLSSVVFVGIHLEQEFGALRIGIIYIVSAISGSLVATLFLRDRPSVASPGALFGLLGAMLSGLIRNWKLYSDKFAALVAILSISVINLVLGLLPYVDNFANIGGFISGFLLGFVLLFSPQIGKMAQNKGGLLDYKVKWSVKFREKLDRPVLRIVYLVLFSLLLAGVIVAAVHGVNLNKYCGGCQYVDCVPSKWWSCSDKLMHCETYVSGGRLSLTCVGSDKFRVFPFTGISQARVEDLCNLICS
ncbi:RHOMBOID-like protein 8 [Actinidia eriantha]|uniref:RHOMBOID-like protein 8 n=1 Tax=Actinidia eriantha TaxID=165200 RepID=UPI00258E2010|nr:RHOMBOID-like protein 8 [Actinidia eriantha]